jgi:hypothetical protein
MSEHIVTGEAAAPTRRRGNSFEWLSRYLILLLAGYFRLANSAVNPGWHSMEAMACADLEEA